MPPRHLDDACPWPQALLNHPTLLGVVRRRCRSGPDRTATLLTFVQSLANQSANFAAKVAVRKAVFTGGLPCKTRAT